jgi:D-cysteine desulfhydrase
MEDGPAVRPGADPGGGLSASWSERLPTLARLPRIRLATLPSPVARLERLGEALELGGLYVKRDDVCARPYAGNKVRKLELLLGAALAAGASGVLSYGAAGSNHVAATAVYARRLGLHAVFLLLPQAPSHLVRRNLLLALGSGAELIPYPAGVSMRSSAAAPREQRRIYEQRHGSPPAVLPFGGTTPLGTIGYVAAAFELADQIHAGLLPEPDLIYVALGSMGTAAGLLLGAQAAGLRTRIVGVRAADRSFTNEEHLLGHLRETRRLLRALDPGFPRLRLSGRDLDVRHGYCEGYGVFTTAGQEAARRLRADEELELDGVYTAKAFAALLDDAAAGRLRGKRVLFWMTCNSVDVTEQIAALDYRDLPAALHSYFEGPARGRDAC